MWVHWRVKGVRKVLFIDVFLLFKYRMDGMFFFLFQFFFVLSFSEDLQTSTTREWTSHRHFFVFFPQNYTIFLMNLLKYKKLLFFIYLYFYPSQTPLFFFNFLVSIRFLNQNLYIWHTRTKFLYLICFFWVFFYTWADIHTYLHIQLDISMYVYIIFWKTRKA